MIRLSTASFNPFTANVHILEHKYRLLCLALNGLMWPLYEFQEKHLAILYFQKNTHFFVLNAHFYREIKKLKKVKTFLSDFSCVDSSGFKEFKYAQQISYIAHREKVSLSIDVADIDEYDYDLAQNVLQNTKRFTSLFSEAVFELIPKFKMHEPSVKDSLDIYIQHRQLLEEQNSESRHSSKKAYPPQLLRRYHVYFKAVEDVSLLLRIRDIKAKHIGKLISLKGVVIRVTEVKPKLIVATYTCDICGGETYQPINSTSFMPLIMCPGEACTTNKSGGRLYLQTRGSLFVKFQEVKVQEHSDQVPVGHVPRCITVHCYETQTRIVSPGDHVHIDGIFLPQLLTGFNSAAQGFLSETFVEAHNVKKLNKANDETNTAEGDDECLTVEELSQYALDDFYEKLASSIAPEIYGHLDIKKALLLLLVGGVDKIAFGQMKIRGNINICLMGDPGVAKSQLLSYTSRLANRSQYSTGRGSSGAGLTVAVTRDPFTDEFVLEGGSLVLADKGVCCIDEFDKMNESDRTAIHEVMEQQTISVAKGGIIATLNARVSILAAANPAYGRYNSKMSLEKNIQLPAALLSRFDLLWLIQDRAEAESDLKLAKHITHVHQFNQEPAREHVPLSMNFVRRYISMCKRKNPSIPDHLTDFITAAYVDLRKEARNNAESTYTSARTLLSILRMSTALARLRLNNEVSKEDVIEALRLMEMSKDSLTLQTHKVIRPKSISHQIFMVIKEIAQDLSAGEKIAVSDIISTCTAKGFNKDQVWDTLRDYHEDNIWQLNSNESHLILQS